LKRFSSQIDELRDSGYWLLVAGLWLSAEHLIRLFLPASSIKHPATAIEDGSILRCRIAKVIS